MHQEKSTISAKGSNPQSNKPLPVHLGECCKRTIDLLSKNNPMMVCQECKQMIKVFSNDSDYRNYVRFCHSRHRTIHTCIYSDLKVVVYQAYNSFGR